MLHPVLCLKPHAASFPQPEAAEVRVDYCSGFQEPANKDLSEKLILYRETDQKTPGAKGRKREKGRLGEEGHKYTKHQMVPMGDFSGGCSLWK